MRTANPITPVPFADPAVAPQHADVLQVIGSNESLGIRRLEEWFETLDGSTYEMKYSPKAGWYEIALLKRRRVFYLIPKPDDFLLNIVIGPRAIMSLVGGPHALPIARMLKTTKHYPEGTLFSFTRQTFDAALVVALCRAKLAHH